MKTLRTTLIALTVITAAVGCSDHPTAVNPPPAPPPPPPPPPPPGSAVISLATPNTDDGAVRLILRGPGLSALQASSSNNLFYSRMVSDSEARVIVVGNVDAGPLFTFKLAAGQQLSAYGAAMQEVASRGDTLRSSLTGYSLSVTAAP